MDNDLNRSVRLLDEAVSSQSRNLLRRAYGNMKKKTFDLSVTLCNEELDEYLSNKTLNYDRTFRTVLDENTALTGSVIRGNEPWKNTADSLYVEFFEILQTYSDSNEVLNLIAEMSRCCSDALNVVKGLKSKVALRDDAKEDLWLENERNTWRLLYVLYGNRLNTSLLQEEKDEDKELVQYYGRSEKYCMLSLFKRESLVREIQLIIDWLECNASQKNDERQHLTDGTSGWENTLHQLQSRETIVFEAVRKIVEHIDPDAPHREKLPLHDLDIQDEGHLCYRIFSLIRSGKLTDAQQLCVQSGHGWRASLFEGWKLYHNPLLMDHFHEEFKDSDNQMEVVNEEKINPVVEGNINRDIWKVTAWKYSNNKNLNKYERAAIAAYCGNLEPLLSNGKSWEDYLWAYLRVMIDVKVEGEIRECISKKFVEMPLEYWEQKMSINEIFESLESAKLEKIKEQSSYPDHVIQKLVILDEISKLIELIMEWILEPNVSSQFLRFLSHFLLFFEHIGQINNRDVLERVVEEYIKRLIDMKHTQLVAFYVSKLNETMQMHMYASYLETFIDNDERKEALNYGEECGLNIFAITNKIVENIRGKHESLIENDLQIKISKLDEFKISSLDWLCFYEIQQPDLLRQTNALIFQFLTLRKLDAAQLAFNKLPTDIIKKLSEDQALFNQLQQAVREYLSYKSYLGAQEAFNDWFVHFKAKPAPPQCPGENAPFTEKVAYDHRKSQYKAEMGRWKLTIGQLSKLAKSTLYNVLLFPDGGWLSGARDAEYLQSICIPQCILLLYNVLYQSEEHVECVQLADVVMDENHKLYEVYSSEKLGELFQKLSESSVALLKQKKDPWGHEMSA